MALKVDSNLGPFHSRTILLVVVIMWSRREAQTNKDGIRSLKGRFRNAMLVQDHEERSKYTASNLRSKKKAESDVGDPYCLNHLYMCYSQTHGP